MEKGVLLLDRNINADYSEYVIPLSEYTFQAVNNFTIKLTKNELEISLLFSSMSDRNMTAARDPVYSYVTIDRCNVNTTPTPRVGLVPSLSLPIRKSRSVDTVLSPNSDFVGMESNEFDSAEKSYENLLTPNLTGNTLKAPLSIPTNTHSSVPIEQVLPKKRLNKFQLYLPFKHSKPPPNTTKRVSVVPQPPRVVAMPY